ncbi:TetR/AcrR family transcriptional regulator [Halomonas sp. ML-15]|uniref:TetR/AcrR family transcriptional regulator n=1 Tax=Halomonas sp. ML-15 TaxID=2773305 RepID=UPI00174696E9|nr:TetR/AcrR family transcriptional regulator [Halomonas sp. ML-15]MBD3896287.1 TetR/AcrR family transcriptional regulator [Halomonas sp. ML-15]
MAMTPVHREAAVEDPLAERILRQALEMAEDEGWEAVELTRVAAALDVPANAVLDHYRDLDAVADAWFLRGWRAMLADKPAGFTAWAARERIEHCLLAWFDALAAHRRVSVEMLRTKAHLPHLHTWVPMVFDLSRTIQWLREAAMLEARYGTRRAQLEEIGLTALFVATLRVWAHDETPGQQETRRYLDKRLRRAESMLQRRWGTPAEPVSKR